MPDQKASVIVKSMVSYVRGKFNRARWPDLLWDDLSNPQLCGRNKLNAEYFDTWPVIALCRGAWINHESDTVQKYVELVSSNATWSHTSKCYTWSNNVSGYTRTLPPSITCHQGALLMNIIVILIRLLGL